MKNHPLEIGTCAIDDKRCADPYLRWADASGFAEFDHHEKKHVDLMIELQPGKSLCDLKKLLNPFDQIAPIYAETPSIRYATGLFTVATVKKLAKSHAVVSRFDLANALHAPRSLRRPAKAFLPQAAYTPKDGQDVLLAVIDDGCPFAHAMLWHQGRYRLRAIWDQDYHPDFSPLGGKPRSFNYGAVAYAPALLKHVATHTYAGIRDEGSCYTSIGYQSAVHAKSHGAHTLGMLLNGASHNGEVHNVSENDGALLDSDVVFVQLPRDVTAVPFHGARLRAMLDGIRWVISQASNTERNIVVALPYGSMMGPHDGSAIFTSAVDELIAEAWSQSKITLKVVLSAGNDYAEYLHWQQDELLAGSTATMTLRLAPGSELPTFVEVWWPTANGKFSVSIADPIGTLVCSDIAAHSSCVTPSLKTPICTVIRTGHGTPGEVALIRFAPTALFMGPAAAATGDWIITINAKEELTCPVHAYISKARGGLGGLKRSNQSRFVVGAGTGSVTSEGTLNDAATGAGTTVVGGYQKWAPEEPASYSSSGPARGGVRRGGAVSISHPQGPDNSMPSEESPLRPGFRNFGNRSASTFRMNGTSVVSPYFAARMSVFLRQALVGQPPPQPPVPIAEKRLGTKRR